jgi:acyl-CoA synthetase (AMP-forming)/AMP-acid ligase II
VDQYNLAVVNEAVAAANPDRPAIITADSTTTYAELTARTRRLANALHQRGFGCARREVRTRRP